MIMSMLITAVPVLAADTVEFKVSADKTTANPGDTVNFSVSIGAVDNFGVLEFHIIVPAGLTIVDSSVKIPDGVPEAMDSDGPIVLPAPKNNYKWSYSAQSTGYTSNTALVILTFSCTVDNDCTLGDKDITISMTDCYTNDVVPQPYTITKETVKIEAAPVAVTGVTIDETLSVNIGQTKTPSYTVNPAEATNKTVSFTSSDTSVATVNATTGAVTGVSKGTATITVKTVDGNFTDTCTVTVSCAHTNKSTVPAKDSTCTVKGWDEYKKCDDCGQLFNTSDVEIDEIPFLNLANHTGGTATCTAKAVCSVCHQPYDDYAAHSYTAETKKAEALKTAGNCRDKAVYYYSCSVCGNVEHDDAHTFLGDKDANTHVGSTSIVNASEPDHKNQVNGYTGDTKCLGCGEIIATGTSIPAGAHTPSSTWNSDGTYHWKECTTMGCGVVIDGSKAKHSSTGTNVATCQHKAICDVCGVEYDELAEHNPASSWTSDASGHWHACQTVGCTEKCDFATHTPDHTGHATEEYAIKCTECGYVIEAQLSHTHVFDKEVATEAYKASDATCTAKATYYKSCACGEKGMATFEYGALAAHNPASVWTSDVSGHWHACQTANCTAKCDFATHTPDHTGHATEEYAIKCTECDYVIEAQLVHTHVFDKEVATEAYKATDATCTAKATYYKSCACGEKGTATFEYGALAAHNPASVWTSDVSGHWHACQTANCTAKCDFATHTPDHTGHATEEYAIKCTECDYVIEAQLVHTHVFDKEVATEAYKATDATCTAKATYYKSCACGEKGTATFEYGELADHNWMPATCTAPKTCNTCRATEGDPLGHDYTKKVENNTYLKTAASNCKEHNVYWYACSRCDANAKDDAAATDKYYTSTTAGTHSCTEKIEDAAPYVAGTGTNCQSVKKYYYDCAYCDQIGTTTWNSTTYGPHDYDTVWSNDKSGHWHECSLCHDKKDEAAHTPGAAATETTPQKCTECDYIITPALGHTHSLTPVAAKDATCTNDGNTAYYVCSGCSKWYEDAAGITVNIAERTLIRTTARLKR